MTCCGVRELRIIAHMRWPEIHSSMIFHWRVKILRRFSENLAQGSCRRFLDGRNSCKRVVHATETLKRPHRQQGNGKIGRRFTYPMMPRIPVIPIVSPVKIKWLDSAPIEREQANKSIQCSQFQILHMVSEIWALSVTKSCNCWCTSLRFHHRLMS